MWYGVSVQSAGHGQGMRAREDCPGYASILKTLTRAGDPMWHRFPGRPPVRPRPRALVLSMTSVEGRSTRSGARPGLFESEEAANGHERVKFHQPGAGERPGGPTALGAGRLLWLLVVVVHMIAATRLVVASAGWVRMDTTPGGLPPFPAEQLPAGPPCPSLPLSRVLACPLSCGIGPAFAYSLVTPWFVVSWWRPSGERLRAIAYRAGRDPGPSGDPRPHQGSHRPRGERASLVQGQAPTQYAKQLAASWRTPAPSR